MFFHAPPCRHANHVTCVGTYPLLQQIVKSTVCTVSNRVFCSGRLEKAQRRYAYA